MSERSPADYFTIHDRIRHDKALPPCRKRFNPTSRLSFISLLSTPPEAWTEDEERPTAGGTARI
jgi:hypothetical protein